MLSLRLLPLPCLILLFWVACQNETSLADQQPKHQEAKPSKPAKKLKPTETKVKKVPAVMTNSPCETDFDLAAHLLQTAQRISLDSIAYNAAKGSDCSGMFHQLLNTVKPFCNESSFPTRKTARDSRAIARWFHRHNNLKIVEDPDVDSRWIQAGTVLFYGYGQRKAPYAYGKLTIDSLSIRGKGINHVAVVVKVNRNERGELESYDIFHGRNPRHPAGITTSYRSRSRHPNLPMYGNWKQPWLAAANILTPKE